MPDALPERGPLGFAVLLRRLAQRSHLIVAGERGGPVRLLRNGQPDGTVLRADFERARRAGLVEKAGEGDGWRLSSKGREAARRLASGGRQRAVVEPGEGRPGHNPEESPLAWLRRRRGRDGEPLISDEAFLAGERLRADFTFAQMGPRVTANWDAALGAAAGSRRTAPGAGAEMADNVLAAGERVNRALKAVGPELAGILLDVCCFLKGLEELERSVGWPQRSGKVVLQIALAQLARHYGIAGQSAGCAARGKPRHWGAPDYRPSLDGPDAASQPTAD